MFTDSSSSSAGITVSTPPMQTILIVDDESEICILLSAILRSMGFNTAKAGSLEEARILVKEKSPHLLFMDINLNDGNGLEEIPEMKRIAQDMPIVMMSAYDTPEMRKQAEEYGARAFLSKPFSRIEVDSVITNIFN